MRVWCGVVVAVSLLCGSAFGAAKTEEEKYPNGKLKSRYALAADGKRSGPYLVYFEDGKIQESGGYLAGKPHGVTQEFYPGGKVRRRAEYREGELHGAYVELDERGRQLKSASYRNGKLSGIYREFKEGVIALERGYIDGVLYYPRSPSAITAELNRIRQLKIETVGDKSQIPPHEGTNDSQQDRENAVRLLMEYRYLSNVPYEPLVLDAMYCAHDEAACALMSAAGFSHGPPNPGWPDEKYQFARRGTGSSNIFSGGGSAGSVNAYMQDAGNSQHLGHRRWCLNPAMGKVGFASHAGKSAMWSFDGSRQDIPEWEYVAFPGAGAYPNTHCKSGWYWSLTLNERKYQRFDPKEAKLTIRPARVNLANGTMQPGDPLRIDDLHYDFSGFGVSNCMIYRPEGFSSDGGSAYLVEVTGLKTREGEPTTIKYLVEFFRP